LIRVPLGSKRRRTCKKKLKFLEKGVPALGRG